MEQGSARNSHPVYQRMDWSINIAREFSVPEEKFHQVGSWTTTTPEKPIPPRSNLMPTERHGDQLGQNWQEMVRLPGQFVPEAANFNGKRFAQQLGSVDILVPQHGRHGHTGTNANHFLGNDGALAENNKMINHIASSCGPALHCAGAGCSYSLTHVLSVHNAAASLSSPNGTHESRLMAHVLGMHNDAPFPSPNRTHESSLGIANAPATPDLLTQDKGRQNNLRESLLTHHSDPSNSFLLSSGHALSASHNRIPVTHRPCYDLDTPPRMEDSAASCTMTSVVGAIDGDLSVKNQFPARANISAGKCSTDRKHSDIVLATENETHQHLFDELLHNIVDCSSTAVSGSSEKTEVLQVRGNTEGIDLNKTPIQKPPKRTKHRPKVIAEGKAKRAAKVVTPKTTTSEEKPPRKRKYVRKSTKELPSENADKPIGKRKYVRKMIGESATPNADSIETTTNFSTEIAVKSCRRALNFDLGVMENERQGSSEAQKMQLINQKEMAVNFNADRISAESSYRGNEMQSTKSASEISQSSQWNQLQEGNQRQAVSSSHIHSTNQRCSNIIDLSEEQAEGLLANTQHIKMEGLTVNRRDTRMRIQQCFRAEGLGQTSSPAKTSFKTIEMTKQIRNSPPSVAGIKSYTTEDRGLKREHHQIDHSSFYNLISMGLSTKQRNDFCQSGRVAGLIGPEISQNKHRDENGLHPQTVYPFCANGYSRPEPSANKAVNKTDNIGVSSVNHIDSMTTGNILSQSLTSSEPHSGAEGTRKTSAVRNSANFSSLTTAENNKTQQTPQTNTAFRDQLQSRTDQSDKSKQWQKNMSAQSASVPRQEVKMVKQNRDAQDCQPPSATSRGQQANKNYSSPIEEITQQLEVLHLNERTIEVDDKEQNALVPYRGDGVIVPYEGLDFIKKRKPRPKVDLDTETERVWKLLMGKEGSEGLEETDKEKEKWWEEERRVFQGRANSFIARMHLVQGDRRFSKWKGSVVDSVIGVFLTQNVSDHLSSSAFMSLAARFPLKSPESSTFDKELTSIVPEQDISKQTRETIKWIEELLTSSHPDESSLTLNESGTDWKDYETWIDRSFYTEVNGHNLEEEFISSQDSSDSLIYQPNGAMGTCSGFNQEAEDLASDFKPRKGHIPSSTDYLQTGRTLFEEVDCGTCESFLFHEKSQDGIEQLEVQINMQQMPRLDKFNEPPPNTSKKPTFCNHSQMQKPVFASSSNWWQTSAESEVLAAEGFRSHGEESVSSRLSLSSKFSKEKQSISTSQVFMQEAHKMDKSTARQSEPQKYQGIPIMEPIGPFNTSPPYEQPTYQPYHDDQLLGRKTANDLESASNSEPICVAKAPEKQPNPYSKQVSGVPKTKGNIVNVEEAISFLDKQTQSDHNPHEPTAEGKINSSDRVTTEANQYYVKTRKGKAEGVKRDAIDWDSLRKKVQFNDGKKERSNDTMDSLDYEALRCASVSEISEAIKERGMNNMLAERIKDFLNRLVKEHGGIDLEWLRDVPPENAKDYLLSIRGLGLKSVECVRLLTLQHLAFPVDTNVGRIAVRLGWVPLQPLPESLQLHLLELYPVLESIQKYLWPRLCKLDQLTLYELHYQLITFGKVFCTKSRPNCNACPMRAECRHFASAFASARLALPGPDEESLTTSTAPIPTARKQALVINNSTLPLAADTSHEIAGSCMPIVEEPATPEFEPVEEMESDIEDMFDQDPDEMPIIRLNVEELTATVQNYVQETMVLQEGDMSKALVVLNPNAASIPAPKLKNISRLRTEHQVYELPDSHPLLEGMERREPDDPSPYLLAIWTPGETSDSIQLPEHRCESHEADKLCDQTCFSCNSVREANSQRVRGTLLIPCRTAMRGSFPLNGTYFQVNEMFADHESSLHPIDVPRAWIWNLPRRMVYFGTSVSSIFKGLATQEIQLCFWKGFVCVRGFELKTRAPRPLVARLHFPASKLAKAKNEKTSIRT